MRNRLPEFLQLFLPRQPRSIKLRKRDRFRKYLFETLEPRNLLATFTVNSLLDGPINPADDATVFTLREAITAANASAGVNDTIQFAPALFASSVPATITLSNLGPLSIAANSGITTIIGPGAHLLSISGNSTGRIVNIPASASADIRELTLRNGSATRGGAIENLGTLAIANSAFESNAATSGDGGAIFNSGTLNVIGSTFSSNAANSSAGAIGVYLGGNATIVNSTFSGNAARLFGGAIDVNNPTATIISTATIINSTIVSNRAQSNNGGTGDGGGISPFGTVTLHNTIVAGNSRTTSNTPSDLLPSNFVQSTSSNNVIGNVTSSGGLVHDTNGNIVGNAGIGTLPLSRIINTNLANNGGNTLTHALQPSSPATDGGNNSLSTVSIPRLFRSGEGTAVNSADPNFQLVSAPPGAGSTALVINRNGGWVANTGDAKWIGLNDSGFTNHPVGEYVYRITFDLTGLDPTTASISGTGSADDSAIIRLNGNATGQTFPAFNVLSTFSITSGFIAGVNTLDFVVSNGGAGPNPTGLLVNSLSGTARLQTDQRGFGSPRIRGSSIDIGAVEAGRTTIDLLNLGPAGTIINGQAAGNQSGYSVSDAGDVNGDGFDDFLVGAPFAAPGSPARSNAGKSYVIFGGSSLPATIDLSDNLSTTNPGVGGFTILGQVANDYSGRSVSSAGDVNGDGFDDLIVGVYLADPGSPARNNSGKSYVIFGKPDWSTTPTITLSDTLSTTNPGVGGFTIFGADTGDQSGFSASSAGDVNGDGFDDLIVGAPFAAPANLPLANNSAGKSYVIFGGSSLPATITLSDTLSTTNPGVGGFTILGQAAGDNSGRSVSSAGDVNGDGFDDLIVGALYADPSSPARSNAGKSYVIFGKPDWSTTPTIILSDTLSTTNPGVGGFTILGQVANDGSGRSVSSAGDVNGDGFDDLIVGAPFAAPGSPARNYAGKSYVIFGGSSLPATITLSDTLSTTNPGVGVFTILGQATGDNSGRSVSSAGDVNGDGFDDLIVGALYADPGSPARNNAGKSYVIFGKPDWSTTPTIILSDTLSTTNPGVGGFTILGEAAGDNSGRSVSSAGDVNGDGFDDLIVGASFAAPGSPARNNAGKSYLIFGGNGFTNSILLANLGTGVANTITGTSEANVLNGADGSDSLIGNGGADVLLGGRGNDILAVSDLNFRRIVGGNGNDTLRLDGTELSLNLSSVRDNRIIDIETIDITGSDNNTLMLNQREVLNISSSTNTLTVVGNAGDRVVIETGWNRQADNGGFQILTKRAATLRVSTGVTIEITPVIDLANLSVDGTIINGQAAYDQSGYSVSDAGDVNGDGFDDLIVGASSADPAHRLASTPVRAT